MGEFLDSVEAVVFSPIDTLHEIAFGTPGPFEGQVSVDQETQDRIRAMGIDPSTAPQSVVSQVSASVAADQQRSFDMSEASNPTSITNLGNTIGNGVPWKTLLVFGFGLLIVAGIHEVKTI